VNSHFLDVLVIPGSELQYGILVPPAVKICTAKVSGNKIAGRLNFKGEDQKILPSLLQNPTTQTDTLNQTKNKK
jgi:hypothetical protein